jgi:hypothetical protein
MSYTIKLLGINQNIFRRYSDFFSLREKLKERWPGIYIPNIPPKILVNLKEMNFFKFI